MSDMEQIGGPLDLLQNFVGVEELLTTQGVNGGGLRGMENFRGKWILVETFFQNEGVLVEIFKGWIVVDIFHEFSWTFFVHENSPK